MSASPGMPSATPPEASPHRAQASAPAGSIEALSALVGSRIAVIQLESRVATRQAGELVALIVTVALAAFFAWALLLAGAIAALAATSGWSWHWIALAVAAVHVAAAAIGLQRAKSAARPAFPITRAEFNKDREWLRTLKTPRKSNT